MSSGRGRPFGINVLADLSGGDPHQIAQQQWALQQNAWPVVHRANGITDQPWELLHRCIPPLTEAEIRAEHERFLAALGERSASSGVYVAPRRSWWRRWLGR